MHVAPLTARSPIVESNLNGSRRIVETKEETEIPETASLGSQVGTLPNEIIEPKVFQHKPRENKAIGLRY
jgi:hypothetical protein